MALNLLPRMPSLSVLAAADNVCRIDLTVLFPDCASIEIGVPAEQPHSVDVQPSTIYVTVTPPTVTVPPRDDHPHGGPGGHPHWPVTATTTCDEEGLVTAMPIPTGRPPFGPGGPGGPGNVGPGSGGPGAGNNGPGNGNNGPGNGGPGGPGNNGPGNSGPGNGGPGNGNNGPGNGGPGNGNNGPGNGGPGGPGNNGPGNGNGGPNGPGSGNGPNPGRPSTTLATITRPALPTSTSTSCPLPPFLSISTTLTDMLDLDLKLYMDLSSLTSGVSSMLESVVPGLGEGLSNLMGANNLPASPSNPPTTQRSRFRTLPCGTSLGSLPGGNTTTVPINDDNTDGPDGNGNGNGNGNNGNNGNGSGSSAIEECIKRCEQDAITTSLELMNLRDCLGVTVDRKTTVDNCLYFVGPKGEKLPILDLGIVVDMTGLLGEDASGAEGVESAVKDGEEVAGDAAAPAVDTTVDTATDAAGDAAAGAVDTASDAVDTVADAVADAAAPAVDTTVDTATDAAAGAADGAVDTATDAAGDAVNTVADATVGAAAQ